MTIYTKLEIENIEYTDVENIEVSKNIGDYNTTSNFVITFDNDNGEYSDTFSLNDEVVIYADLNTSPATTKIFTGIIEKIDYQGIENNESIILKGRDYGAILQDIQISPRVWKDKEVSVIVGDIMSQNVGTSITTTNINTTTTTLDRITFQNISVFDTLKELAEISGFFFYIDVDKDLHFEEKANTSSGLTFDNTNITAAHFKVDDSQIFNKVTVYGDRILAGHEQYKTANGGSAYYLDYSPHNLTVFKSGTTNTIYQPGGVLNINDPQREDVKWLVDFQSKLFVMTSGTTAGDNIPTSGTDVLFTQYQKNTPIIRIKSDYESQVDYGLKEKIIPDRKIKTPEEGSVRAQSFLDEHKQPKIQGDLDIHGIVDVIPGQTAIVNIPYHNVDNQTYTILSAEYKFNKRNSLGDNVLRVTVNKKVQDFTDTTKDILLRLKQSEMSQVDAGVVTLQSDTGSVGVSGTWYASRRDIGSAFYFHTPGHNLLNSDTSLLGDMRAGSIVVSGGF